MSYVFTLSVSSMCIQSLRAFRRGKIVPRAPYMGDKIHTADDVNTSPELFQGPDRGSGMLLRVSLGVPGGLGAGACLGVPGGALGFHGVPQRSTRIPRDPPWSFLGCLAGRHGRFEKH